jgi:PAS domain S-box-containing protein
MMDGVSRHSWLLALVMLLGVGGYVLTSTTIRNDRDEAAQRRAQVEAVHAQEVLGRARAYVDGLAEVLEHEPEPGQARFARWAGATSTSVGLNDVLWVERVAAAERRRYEALHDIRITRLTSSGRLVPAPAAPSFLPATYTSQTRPELRRGVDVTSFLALSNAIRDGASIFAVGASRPGSLGGEPGFYLLEAARFARGRSSRGYLVAFVPRGWFSTTLGGDPRRVAISQDARRIEGEPESVDGSARFEMLGRRWGVDVGREPPSRLQSMLPWLALAWPFAIAGIVVAFGRIVTQRRRAQREVERIFELALDMIAVSRVDGRLRTVNPAFERTLGYSPEEMLSRPFLDFVHPDDREESRQVFADVIERGHVSQFENRYICADGSERWLQWSARVEQDQSVVYATARDVTDQRRLAGEQASLRRVATLVAEGVPSTELFDAVAREVGTLLGGDFAGLARFEDESVVAIGVWAADGDHPPVPARWHMQAGDPATTVAERRAATRWNDWSGVPGEIAEFIRQLGIQCTVGTPIMVEGRVWGALALHSRRASALPPDTEARMGQFTDLVGTAIANAQARGEVARLAEEQAALWRVATLVARDASQVEVFTAVAREIGELIGTEEIRMVRYEGDQTGVVVASAGEAVQAFPVGFRIPLTGDTAVARVFQTGEPVRIDDYALQGGPNAVRWTGMRGVVGTPLIVEGRLWGAITAGTTKEDALPPGTESRLGQFTELMATAVSNAESHARADRLAAEQAALRRIATLVAEAAPPADVLDAVAGEMEKLLEADQVALNRFERGDVIVVLAHRGLDVERTPVGSRVSTAGESATATVRRTGQPTRVEDYEGARGALAELARATGLRSSVSTPIMVEGRLWGLITASWKSASPPPADTEQRMTQFARLLGTAIANADARGELMASRARLVAASDEARRRFERDLHDGVQQRLVSLSLELRGAEAIAPPEHEELAGQLSSVAEGLAGALDDLRELSRGIHPAILSEGGLVPALKALARRAAIPVLLDASIDDRLPERVEVAAYYVVSEALTNAAKHAEATAVRVLARSDDGRLELRIDDDGVGGADPGQGSGLTGLADRIEALGGEVWVASPPGEGTSLRVVLSLDSQ